MEVEGPDTKIIKNASEEEHKQVESLLAQDWLTADLESEGSFLCGLSAGAAPLR